MKLPEQTAFHFNPPVTPDLLLKAEQEMMLAFPDQLKEFLRLTNGAGDGGLLIYATDEIAERNESWEVAEYMPGFIAIGDTGGGEVLLIKLDPDDLTVYKVGSGVMDAEMAERVADSLEAWVESGFVIQE